MGIFDRYDKMIHGWVERAVEATMPRQAIVTRSEGNGVWVRFTPVDSDKPEMWFPSTVTGLPAGAQGWVHPLAGGKGRFIATAVPTPVLPRSQNLNSSPNISISTAGTYAATAVTVSGLVPGQVYRVMCTGAFQINNDGSGDVWGRVGFRVAGADGTSDAMSSTDLRWPSARTHIAGSESVVRTANASGEIIVTPIVRWSSGAFTFAVVRGFALAVSE